MLELPPYQSAHLATSEALPATLVLARLVSRGGQAARHSRYAQATGLAKFVSFHPELTAKSRTARQGAAEGTRGEGHSRNIHGQSGLGGSAQIVFGPAVGSASWRGRVAVTGVEGCKQEGSMQWAAGRAST